MARLLASAAYRIAFAYSSAFALAIAVLGTAVYFAADAAFRHQQDAGIAEESAALVREFREGGLPDLDEAIAKREMRKAISAFGYAVFDRHGRRVAGALDAVRPPPGLVDVVFTDPVEGKDNARALATDLGDGVRLVVAKDADAILQVDETILVLFGIAFAVLLAMGVGGALLLGRALQHRIGRISATATAIVGGDLARRVPVSRRDDEFDALAVALNAMLDRIAQLLDNLRQVSADIAHDLRTPLSRLRGELEAALDGPVGDRAPLKRALRQSDELLSLFAAILRISEIEGAAWQDGFATLDVGALAADLFESYAPAVADGGRSIVATTTGGLLIQGDRELISQALINLLDNAQRHTPPGTHLWLGTEASDTRVHLVVADDGAGVSVADRPRIVRRFVRLEGSRSTPGHGLGLNLVSAIAAAHRGELILEDNHPGLRAVLALPRVAAA